MIVKKYKKNVNVFYEITNLIIKKINDRENQKK